MIKVRWFLVVCSLLLVCSCSKDEEVERVPDFKDMMKESAYHDLGNTSKDIEISTVLKSRLKEKDLEVRIAILKADYLTMAESGKMGKTVLFMDVGNKKLDSDFLPFLSLDGTADISYYIDDNKLTDDIDGVEVNQAIIRAMVTWNNITCSNPGLYRREFDPGLATGFVLKFFQDEGLVDPDPPGSYEYVADILHAGWFPRDFFDLLVENGGDFILAATFDLIFIDQNGEPIDLDNNGKADSAIREIYYNDAFSYAVGDHVDIETVALHEAGHGLSQGHFGTLFQIDKTGRFQFAPRAVMNAGYTGLQTRIAKTDQAGHCSNWSSWPER